MQLLTEQIITSLPELYATDGQPAEERAVVAKFFLPETRLTWYALEGRREPDGDWLFFGFVESPLGADCDELGYFLLSELAGLRSPRFGLPVERDLHWDAATTLAAVQGRAA